jgi:glycosyltransferase involved in cell wall biosynthesis
MATFNGARHVQAQLSSIVGQSVTPLEILIGDDGSTDGTVELIHAFSSQTEVPVRVTVNSERLGFAENFLRTASEARGRLTAFADQDDVWLPGRLAAATSSLRATEATLWVSGWRMVDEDLEPLLDRRLHTGFLERTAMANPLGVISGSRLVFRSDVLDYAPPECRPISLDGGGPASHDEWVCFAARVLGRMVLSREVLMLYRRHGGAATIANPAVARRRSLLRRAGEGAMATRPRAAMERAEYLRTQASTTQDPRVRERMLAAASVYEALTPRLKRRLAAHSDGPASRRARALLRNILRGDYGRLSKGRLGMWPLAQDMFSLLPQ